MAEFMLKAWWLGRKLPRIALGIGEPDVVIGSSPDLLTALAACWIAYRFSVPFVMEVRDLWPQTILDMGAMSPRHPIIITLRVLEKYLYRRAERIITLLPLAHNYIAACGVPQKKILWLPNGVDLSRFDQISNPGTPGSGSDLFRVMYLGAHGRANALNVLLEAAKIIQDLNYSKIRIVLVGDGPEKPGLIDHAQRMRLKNTEFRDPVPKNAVVRTLLDADGLIINLEDVAVFKYGISPNKVFEYMAADKPVIFSVQAANNPVEDSHCGITVPPKDPQALARAIIRLSEMSVREREEMGRRGREYVAKHHDISVLAERLERMLVEVVHEQ
jgi:glycosyltransferase involved in cell wall biosynthesis